MAPKRNSQRTKNRRIKKKQSIRIPFAVGFKLPDRHSKMKAIGFGSKTPIPHHYNIATDLFKDIPDPTSIDDWLAQYVEEPQTYQQYLQENPWFSKRKLKCIKQTFCSEGKNLPEKYPDGKIYVVPVGEFDEGFVDFEVLVDYVRRFFDLPIATLPAMNLQESDGNIFAGEKAPTNNDHIDTSKRFRNQARKTKLVTRFDIESNHHQIRVDSILTILRRTIPDDALCVIGLTSHDLYGDNTDLFVAGMASGNERVAIFSVFRYDPVLTFCQEFWYNIKSVKMACEDDRKRLILQRSCKLVVHEISHLLGIAHCVFFDCCMNGSGHLEEDFRQSMHLCPVDLHKLETLCGFDAISRYKKLLVFYDLHGFKDEVNWVTRRIEQIKNS